MATKLKTDSVKIHLLNHGLMCCGNIAHNPEVIGTFDEDPVTGNDGNEYAVFTIADSEDGSHPSGWAGTYRVSVSALAAHCLPVFTTFPDGYEAPRTHGNVYPFPEGHTV